MTDLKTLLQQTQKMRVLYVEDDEEIRHVVGEYLEKFFMSVESAENGKVGLEKYQLKEFDMVLSDISMPIMNGLEMISEIRKLNASQEIIIVSAYSQSEYFIESIKIGVSGYIMKPIDFQQMNDTLYRSAIKINALKEVEDYKQNLIHKVEERTLELHKSMDNARQLQNERIENYEKTIFSFIEMVERRDSYTAGHSQRVANYSKLIAKSMGYDSSTCERLYQACMLHDIGKVATPDSVLLKPGILTELEYRLIQEHVKTSFNLLDKIPMYKELAEIVRFHHERYDGKGYPYGISGDAIPALARIMIVADAFDAMTTNRIYKARKDVKDALVEIEKLSKIQFHPEVVDAAIKVLKDITIDSNINQLPVNELEEKRFAYFFKDSLTDAYGKNYLELVLLKNQELKSYKHISIVFIKNFSQYNKELNWESGDKLLFNVASFLKTSYENTLVFRIYGDDFLLLSELPLVIDASALEKIDRAKENGLEFNVVNYELDKNPICSLDDLENLLLEQ